jgi:hypothetical protein
VDGTPTPDVETFLKVVSSKLDGETVRVKISSLRGKPAVTTVTLDNTYWPPTDVKMAPDGNWSRHVLDHVLDQPVGKTEDGGGVGAEENGNDDSKGSPFLVAA